MQTLRNALDLTEPVVLEFNILASPVLVCLRPSSALRWPDSARVNVGLTGGLINDWFI
jgi:hypothetical protein